MRESLVIKIALVLLVTLTLGFALPAAINARLQLDEMRRSGRAATENVAQGLAAGVRTAMLSGNGITARNMIREARERLATAEVRIYAPSGEEVFGELPPPPAPERLPAHVRAVLAGEGTQRPDASTTALPVPNEERCRKCHEQGELRGVLTLGTAGAPVQLAGGDETDDALGAVASSAFVQIMTAEHEDRLDAYLGELAAQVDGLRSVTVLDPDGDAAFSGGPELALDPGVLRQAYATGEPVTAIVDGVRARVRPLANDPQCHACHEEEDRWRGVLVTATTGPPEPRQALLSAADVSLRHVMLSGLGRLIARFLDGVAATGTVSSLTLHDAQGRLYRDAFAHPEPPAAVAEVLHLGVAGGQGAGGLDEEAERFVFVEPLTNDAQCQQCHGTDYELRGAIEVVVDTSAATESRRRLMLTGLGFAALTIVVTLGLLYFGLRFLVVRPVSTMGDVADRVGEGRLDVRVPVRSRDEIGRLGDRLNHMIGEIRKKLELSKFVSKATVGSVDASESTVERQGQRTRLTVLFSDVRGFTAFSETVEPEEVVVMLNRYLEAQAEVVERHGGDIDKFVGDELMATFRGPGMEARALACAVEMVEAVEAVNAALPPEAPRLQVGVGLNAGEVVLGAMGARSRMDFTVIGDAVNLGARLCSAAGPGQVIASAVMRREAGEAPGLRFEALPPISVKGKREPVEIWAVTRPSKRRDAPSVEGASRDRG
ncbi:MAG: HAMP domain-containing protein [Myxococcales bacterium]|nr:HAMP domain-containing protein [Myxococcales bacterium]